MHRCCPALPEHAEVDDLSYSGTVTREPAQDGLLSLLERNLRSGKPPLAKYVTSRYTRYTRYTLSRERTGPFKRCSQAAAKTLDIT